MDHLRKLGEAHEVFVLRERDGGALGHTLGLVDADLRNLAVATEFAAQVDTCAYPDLLRRAVGRVVPIHLDVRQIGWGWSPVGPRHDRLGRNGHPRTSTRKL